MSFAKPVSVDDLLNYRLSCLLSQSGAMVTRLCEGRYGVTRREWRLVCILAAQGAMSPSALAERAHLERARVSRHITDLGIKKLLERAEVAGDKRRALVALTPRGQALYEELFPQSVKLNNALLGVLTDAELAAFDLALGRLSNAAENLCHSSLLTEKADRRHGGSRRFTGADSNFGLK